MSGASGKAADQVLLAAPDLRARQTWPAAFSFQPNGTVIAPQTKEKMINPTTAVRSAEAEATLAEKAMMIAVFRPVDDRNFALEDKCPHRNGALGRDIVHDGCVTCPLPQLGDSAGDRHRPERRRGKHEHVSRPARRRPD
jgi:hypothetical protein